MQGSPSTFERWAPVPGFEAYIVSNHGRVFSLFSRKEIAKHAGRHGLVTVRLFVPGSPRAHRLALANLVLRAFGPPRLARFEAAHVDGNRSNCRLENLTWRLKDDAKRLDRTAVGVIRLRLKRRESQRSVARAFGVAESTISKIAHGLSWRDVPARAA